MKKALLILIFIVFLAGCSHKVTTNFNPKYKEKEIEKIYVHRFEKDTTFHVYKVIKDELDLLGFKVSIGSESKPNDNVDAIVTYKDKWMWDMSNYLLRLDLTLIDSVDYESISETSVYRTSLIRKSKKNVVREALSELLIPDDEKEKYINSEVRFNGSYKVDKICLVLNKNTKNYVETVSNFFNNSSFKFMVSEYQYPPESCNAIADVYSLRGNKYLQFRGRETKNLIAEIFLEKIDASRDIDPNLDKKIIDRLKKLSIALNEDTKHNPPYYLK